MCLWEVFASRKEYFLTVITPLLLSLMQGQTQKSVSSSQWPFHTFYSPSFLFSLDQTRIEFEENKWAIVIDNRILNLALSYSVFQCEGTYENVYAGEAEQVS